MILNLFPSLTAPKGANARAALGTAFEEYFKNFDPVQSSAMIRARYASNKKHGVTLWNQGRLEVGTLLGILANTIPAAFYMLVHIYSDASLLQDVREELEARSVSSGSHATSRTLHAASLREKCPLLSSVWQELLRVHALGASSRFVREDVVLDGRYLLRKNGVVQMPMAVMHSNQRTWGDDAASFRPRRFLERDAGRKGASRTAAAYRPFGGGASMCPGRHLVAQEILALTAYLVLRYDMEPSEGRWYVPEGKQESLATNVFPPDRDIKVKILKRRGYEDVQWGFEIK